MGTLSRIVESSGRFLAAFAMANVLVATLIYSNAQYVLHQVERFVYYVTGQVGRRNKNEYLLGAPCPMSSQMLRLLRRVARLLLSQSYFRSP
jgi:hypothetical protein